MSREKKIEEMAQCLCEWNRGTLCVLDDKDCDLQCTYGKLANKLTAKGYRKASEVAEEIFGDIEVALTMNQCQHRPFGSRKYVDYFANGLEEDIAELKKKYTGDEK